MAHAGRDFAVYVHTPFCPSKCGYCDFNSFALEGMEPGVVKRTIHAIVAEIERTPWAGRPARTIFFGGGTPTYLPVEGLIAILDAVRKVHPPAADCEITSEANPGTVDAEKFAAMREAGFNRISLGAQSFFEDELVQLGRVHRVGEIERAVAAAKAAGFDNFNLDLMFGLPNQTLRAWRHNVERAIALKPEHLSLYGLTIEPNTAFYKLFQRGRLPLPEEESQVEMYDLAVAKAAEGGYLQYEISNFAKPGRECRHNLEYWRGHEYAGYGPGAVGCVASDGRKTRYTNLKHPARYCQAVEEGQRIAFEEEDIDASASRSEQVMLGLRLNEGFYIDSLELDEAGLKTVLDRGWATLADGRLRLTESGKHFCSEVTLALI